MFQPLSASTPEGALERRSDGVEPAPTASAGVHVSDASGPEPDGPARSAGYRSRTALIFALAEVAGKIASFAMFAVATRYLGPEGYGTFAWAFGLAAIAASLGMFGFDMALIQLAGRDRSRVSEYLADSIALRGGIGVLSTLAVLVIPLSEPQARSVLVVMTVALNLENISAAVRAALTVVDRQRGAAFNIVAQRLAISALSIVVLVAGYGVFAMALTYMVGTALGTVTMLVLGWRAGAQPRPALVHRGSCLEMLRQAILPGAANTLNMLTSRLDLVVLARYQGLAAVGFFSAGYKLIETSLFISDSLARAAMPAYLTGGRERLAGQVRAVLTLAAIFYFPLCVAFILRGDDLLSVLFGAEFGPGGQAALAAMSLGLVGLVAVSQLTTALLSRGRNGDVSSASAATLAFKAAIVVPLVATWGTVGAGVSVTCAFGFQACFLFWRLTRLGARPRFAWGLVPPIVASALMGAVLVLVPELIAAGMAAALTYAAVWFVLARRLDPDSMARVRSLMHR